MTATQTVDAINGLVFQRLELLRRLIANSTATIRAVSDPNHREGLGWLVEGYAGIHRELLANDERLAQALAPLQTNTTN
jgi:hypothetical protein